MALSAESRILITGASRGIGRALAQSLAAPGRTIGLVARSADELIALAAELEQRGATALPLPADVADRRQIEAAVERFVAEAGGIDVLVAGAGIAIYAPIREQSVEDMERMTAVNWMGTVYTVKAALPAMLDRAEGNITIISSAVAHRSFPWAAVYSATKYAQRAFGEALRHELSGTGVKVTLVYPGEVDTGMHDEQRARQEMPDWYKPETALPAAEVAAEIVAAIDADKPELYVPSLMRLLAVANGVSPKLADRILRSQLGAGAAPWRG